MAGVGGIKVGQARVVIDPSWSGFEYKLRRFLRSEEYKHSTNTHKKTRKNKWQA